MGLESTDVVSGLVVGNPAGSDSRSQGDDHLRLLKTVLKNTFPGTGYRFNYLQNLAAVSTLNVETDNHRVFFNDSGAKSLSLPDPATLTSYNGNGFTLTFVCFGTSITLTAAGTVGGSPVQIARYNANPAAGVPELGTSLVLSHGQVAVICFGNPWIALLSGPSVTLGGGGGGGVVGVTSVNGDAGPAVFLDKADIGLPNVEDKSSSTIRSEITSNNVTTALGYTPQNAATAWNTGNFNPATKSDVGHTHSSYMSSDVGITNVGGMIRKECGAVDAGTTYSGFVIGLAVGTTWRALESTSTDNRALFQRIS